MPQVTIVQHIATQAWPSGRTPNLQKTGHRFRGTEEVAASFLELEGQ